MGEFYTFENVELVRIGRGQARVTKVDNHAVHYTDEAGNKLKVDLGECRCMFHAIEVTGQIPPRNETDWAGTLDALPPSERKIAASAIGMRARMDSPPWFQFTNRRRTQFEFADMDAMNSQLMDPLVDSGGESSSWDCS